MRNRLSLPVAVAAMLLMSLVAREAQARQRAAVSGEAQARQRAAVSGEAQARQRAAVSGEAQARQRAAVSGEAQARQRAAVSVAQAAPGQRGQRGRGNAAPAPPHDPHDLTGIWNLGGGQDLSLSLAPPPMTPQGQKKFDANKPSYGRELGSADAAAHPEEHIGRRRGVPPAQGNDPIGDCNPLGWPRLFFFGRPVEIIQLPDRVVQFWEWSHIWRTIWTDGRPLPKDPDARWYGYSIGRWDGDTFVVETMGVDDRTWVDHFGDVHSEAMHLTERWHRLDRDNMEVTMVMDDPETYTKPWVSDKKILRLQPNHELREELCAPVDEESFNRRTRNPAGGVATKK